MKHIMALCLCLLLLTVALCGCSPDDDGEITTITKASVSYSLHTTTTTAPTTLSTTCNHETSPGQTAASATPTTLPTVAADGKTSEVGNAVAQTAISLIGTPFESGATGPDSFDNPGFVSYCYKQAGYSVTRRVSAMLSFGVEAPLSALQPGDILIFCNEIGGDAQFVGIYIGGDRFVACNNPETPTKTQKLDNTYWLPRLLTARRAA